MVGADRPRHAVVMGVSGSGKSTVAEGVAAALGWELGEADSFHPRANIEKMASGVPLTDDDRWPWLGLLAEWIAGRDAVGRSTVLACSALRRSYRDVLRADGLDLDFIHLAGPVDLVATRLAARAGHFMPTTLLDSQYATLEDLEPDEAGIVLDVALTPQQLVDAAVAHLLSGAAGPGPG